MRGPKFSLTDTSLSSLLTGNTLEPVSYTHLDVYKRQIREWRLGWWRISA
ncbi:hypothetical protein [Erwinia amylovora]